MPNAMTTTAPQALVPIKDDTPDSADSWDRAGSGSFNLSRLLGLVAQVQDEPDWRRRADVAAGYVDGKQFTPEQEAAARAEGLGEVRPTNLIGRVIRSVCGAEAKARTDVKVEADDDEIADTSDALNSQLKEGQREAYIDMAVSAAYFGQVGPGIGWVETAYNTDPQDYYLRVAEVHRSEMYWDFKDPDLILRGARWVARMRWQDLDELEARMPKHRILLRQVSNSGGAFSFDNTMGEESRFDVAALSTVSRWNDYQRRVEWFDGPRRRIKMYEVWYKMPAMGVFMHVSPTRRILFDPNNQAHIQAVASSQVPVTQELTRQVRCALFAGPYRLMDYGTRRRNFPYVPFFAYRDDFDMSPYGLVEGMIAPQDGYNKRRLRVEWLLKARQIMVDNDALDVKANTLAEIADKIMRPDLVAVLNANRKNVGGLVVLSSLQLQKEQLEVMQDDKQNIQDVPGVYGSQLGQSASGVTSGIANSLLIEQGAVAMGDLNDNYRHARRMVYENTLDLIVERHSAQNLQMKIGRGSSRRVVVLNQWDPEQGVMLNNVMDAAVRVGLGEVPSTPAFRMQQQAQIATIIQAVAQVNPQAAAVLVPSFIEATDMPDRMERADDARRAMGIPTAGDKQAMAEQQEAQAQQAAKEAQVKDQIMQLELEAKAAEVEKTRSDTELNKAKVIDLGHKMAVTDIETADAERDAERASEQAREQARTQAEQGAADAADKAIIERQNALIKEALDEALAEA